MKIMEDEELSLDEEKDDKANSADNADNEKGSSSIVKKASAKGL